jgi:tRNA threonylcarbamoyladenosine biosynthesis protein TsaE
MKALKITTHSADETETLGREIGALLQPGMFLALQGDLGGGKTCFTRGVVASVAPQSAHLVASPTYAIMNCYHGTVPVYHFDLYRLAGDDDVAELGFEEFFYGEGICIVEWSERLTELLPKELLIVRFDYCGEEQRQITITPSGTAADAIAIYLARKWE